MFFYLSKLLAFILAPLLWVFILVISGLFIKEIKKKRRLYISSLLVLFFFSNPFLFNEAIRAWEIPPKKDSELSQVYEVGIVLGGIANYDLEYGRLKFNQSADRLFQGIDLYKKGKIKKILFTGGSGIITQPTLKEGLFIYTYMLSIGIPAADIILEKESKNTRENALFTKKLLRDFPGNYLLITSAFHMRRATGCFRKVGIETTSYSTDQYGSPRSFLIDSLLIPNVEVLSGWTLLIHEITGFIVYKIVGYA
jgi:uncharacterized SAM-binding protein YcdF (DUF218 family)